MVVASAAWSRPPSPCCTLNWPANLFCISSSSSSPYFWLPSFWFSLCHSANAAIPSHYHRQSVYPGFLLPLISVVWSVEGSMTKLLRSFQICEEQLPGCDFFPDLLDMLVLENYTGQCESYINVISLIARIVEFCYYQDTSFRQTRPWRWSRGTSQGRLLSMCVSFRRWASCFFGQLQVLPPILCVGCNLAHLLFRFKRGKNLSLLRRWVKSSCTSKRSEWVETVVITSISFRSLFQCLQDSCIAWSWKFVCCED